MDSSTIEGGLPAARTESPRHAPRPKLKLYVVHGSHPCAAVEQALSLKGLPYRVIEWPQPLQAPIQRVLFGVRTVPALRIDGAEKISGSRAIMRRLDQLVPEPALYPVAKRAAVEEAELWGEVVLQEVARRLTWTGLRQRPVAMVSYAQGARIPLPTSAVKLLAPIIIRVECALNRVTESTADDDLSALVGSLDKIDRWIADGTIGEVEQPNAADLQIGSSIALLRTMADIRPLLDGRPCTRLAEMVAPVAGELPLGTLAGAARAPQTPAGS
jgi:glutathione S-transferase